MSAVFRRDRHCRKMEDQLSLQDAVSTWTEPVTDFIKHYYGALYDPAYRFPLDALPRSPWQDGDMIREDPSSIQEILSLLEDKFKPYGKF